jgi:putative intracellular protease/amidase
MRVLIVTTSCYTLGGNHPTGLWLEEFAVPFTELCKLGAIITVASPDGGVVPLDPKSEPDYEQRIKWSEALEALTKSLKLSQINPDNFDALFFPGGHGPVKDLADNADVKRIVESLDRKGAVIAAVCHGPAALLSASKVCGEPLVAGRKVAGFSNLEERMVGLYDVVPFRLEDALKEKRGQIRCWLAANDLPCS